MTRAFFIDVEDALVGFLPPALRGFHVRAGGRNLKVWYGDDAHEHYEVQMISAAVLRGAGLPGRGPAIEIGLHAEHPGAARNEQLLARLRARETTLRRALGAALELGAFVGRQPDWRRASELWRGEELLSAGTAVDAAERLARYIRTLEPLRTR